VPERWVINASPVILLAKAGVIHLLPALCDELAIPAGVVGEVEKGNAADAGRTWLKDEGHKFVQDSAPLHPALADWGGGMGEAEVISWALRHPGFSAILDDRAARALARRHRIPVFGSLRVIITAKERGLIKQARPALEKLRGAGAYVSDDLINRAISLAGES
jgi:predicted nucleic acid-binding protein